MSEYSKFLTFPQFRPHSNSELIAQREMEKVSSPPAILLLLYFYFQHSKLHVIFTWAHAALVRTGLELPKLLNQKCSGLSG